MDNDDSGGWEHREAQLNQGRGSIQVNLQNGILIQHAISFNNILYILADVHIQFKNK